jgi:hypothetical protein
MKTSNEDFQGSARAAAGPSDKPAAGRPRRPLNNARGGGARSSKGAAPAAAVSGESPMLNLPTLCRAEDARRILKEGRPQLLEKYKELPTYEDMVRRAVALGLDCEDVLWVRVPSKHLGREDWKQLERECGEILGYCVYLSPTEGKKR